jgi:hypothetical protein
VPVGRISFCAARSSVNDFFDFDVDFVAESGFFAAFSAAARFSSVLD